MKILISLATIVSLVLFAHDLRASSTLDSVIMASGPAYIIDTYITGRVKSEFLLHDSLSKYEISVTTEHGVVMLSGIVNEEVEMELAIKICEDIEGVKGVINKMTCKNRKKKKFLGIF